MNHYMIATEEGQTISPYGRRCENQQLLGFSQGKTKEEAIERFISNMEEEDLFEIEGWDKDQLIAYQLNETELN